MCRLSRSWRPSSWLGMLVGTKVYVDFSNAHSDVGAFGEKFDSVLRVREPNARP